MLKTKGMLHELWEEEKAGTLSTLFCVAGPRGDAARATLTTDAKLIWTVWARSHSEAMTLHHERLGPEPYRSDEPWDLEPYPQAWIDEQRSFLSQLSKR